MLKRDHCARKTKVGWFWSKKKKKKGIEIYRKAQFQCGRTKLMPPLCSSLALSPDSGYVRNMFVESLQGLTEQTCQRFSPCQKKRRPMDARPADGLGQAGDAGNTQQFSVLASLGRIAAANEPMKRRGFFQSDQYHIGKRRGKKPSVAVHLLQ